MRSALILVTLSILLSSAAASAGLKISLVTVGPASDFFGAFGHSALLVEDSAKPKASEIFEYSGVNANALAGGNPIRNFGMLLNGRIRVALFPTKFADFKSRYSREITIDPLTLSQSQAKSLVDALKADQATGSYQFEMFINNCATKIRDQVFAVLDKSIRAAYDGKSSLTYKDIVMSSIDEAAAKNGSVEFPINVFAKNDAQRKQVTDIMQGMGIPTQLKSGADYDTAFTAIGPLMELTPIAPAFKYVTESEMKRSITDYEALMTPKRLRDALVAKKLTGKPKSIKTAASK